MSSYIVSDSGLTSTSISQDLVKEPPPEPEVVSMCVITLNGLLFCELAHPVLRVHELSGKTSCFRLHWHRHLLRQLIEQPNTPDCEITNPSVCTCTRLEKKKNQPPFMNAGLEVQCSQFWCAAEAAAISPDEVWYGLGNSSARLSTNPAFLCAELTELVCTEILCKNSRRYTWTLKAVDFCPFAKTRPER